MRPNRKGATLGITLLAAAIAVIVGFSMAGLGFMHTGISAAQASSAQARNLAESVVSRAVERILDSQDFRRPGHDEYTQVMTVSGTGGARGLLAFEPAAAAREDLPLSCNRLGDDSSAEGWDGRPLPPDSVHLVGVGRCGRVERKLEVILYVPPFPYVVGSSGGVAARGGLRVTAVDDPALLPGGFDELPPERVRPGHLSSNSLVAEAVKLVGESLITGDILASGGISLDERAVVRGAVRPYADPVELPVIDVTRLDTVGRENVQTVTSLSGPSRLSGYVRAPGRLVVDGDLQMDGAVIYVGQELVVNGGLRGKGLVAVNGPLTVHGGTSLAADNQAALVVAGNVGLYGNDRGGSSFQGLVYTEGRFQASHITLAGTFIANGRSAEVSLEDTDLVHLGDYTKLEVPLPQPSAAPTSAPPDYSHATMAVRVGSVAVVSIRARPVQPDGSIDLPNATFDIFRQGEQFESLPYNQALVRLSNELLAMADVYEAAAGTGSSQTASQQNLQNAAWLRDQATDPASVLGGNSWTLSQSPRPAPTSTSPPGSETPTYVFDLSEFIGLAGRIRVLLWKER